MDIRGKRALVMGLGIHGGGLGVARFLADQGARVTVTDLRGPEQLQSSLDALADLPITYVLGQHRDSDFSAADLVIRNPGVPRESRYLQIARAAGAAIEMEMTLFFRLCPGPILGITGTKGKTTTTLLTAAMLREQYPDTVVAGNLRVSALEALPRITAGTPVVLELSSWQLEGLGEAKLSPKYACITNISPDHLDRYGSMAAYAEAKKQIYMWQASAGTVILNYDDDLSLKFFHGPWPGEHVWAMDWDLHPNEIERARSWPLGRTFIAAHRDGEIFWDHSDSWLYPWYGAHPGYRPDHDEDKVFDRGDLNLKGAHNVSNALLATALAKSFGVKHEHIRNAIRNFGGVEHRLEFVREIDGVRYTNDTAATAPEAAIAALRSFDRPIVLIAGGADKNLPFDGLAREIGLRAKAVVLLQGTATPKLIEALQTIDDRRQTIDDRSQSPIVHRPSSIVGPLGDFAEAIAQARRLAAPGDVVLLSPGCASFGMFRNEFHRGEEFRRIVQQL